MQAQREAQQEDTEVEDGGPLLVSKLEVSNLNVFSSKQSAMFCMGYWGTLLEG